MSTNLNHCAHFYKKGIIILRKLYVFTKFKNEFNTRDSTLNIIKRFGKVYKYFLKVFLELSTVTAKYKIRIYSRYFIFTIIQIKISTFSSRTARFARKFERA